MTLAPGNIRGWAGRELFDPYDVHVGRIAELRDGWMSVELADGQAREVPVAGAAPSGRAIRTPYTAEQVLARRVQPPSPAPRPHAIQTPRPPAAGSRQEMAAVLRETHARLRATIERLAALRWRLEDEELVHDVTFHHVDVEEHAAALRVRLAELDDTRAPLRDGLVKLRAWLHVERRHAAQTAATADAQEAVDLARDEMAAWAALGDLARRHGDTPTAELADRGHADAEALLYTVAASWRRFEELDHQRRGTSAFAPPPDLSDLAPRT